MCSETLSNMSVAKQLLQAIRHNDPATVETLLGHPDLDINEGDKEGNYSITPLYEAITYRNQVILAAILNTSGINVNARRNYSTNWGTALGLACMRDYKEGVALLLTMPNIAINEPDRFGDTPLSDALTEGHMGCAALLLQRPDIDINCRNNRGETALWRVTHRAVQLDRKTPPPALLALLARPDLDHVHPEVVSRHGQHSAVVIAGKFQNHCYIALLTPTSFWRLQSSIGGHNMALYPFLLMTQVGLGWQLLWPASSLLWPSLPVELITLVLTHLATALTWPDFTSIHYR